MVGPAMYHLRDVPPPGPMMQNSQAMGLKFWNNLEQLSMVPDRGKKKEYLQPRLFSHGSAFLPQ